MLGILLLPLGRGAAAAPKFAPNLGEKLAMRERWQIDLI